MALSLLPLDLTVPSAFKYLNFIHSFCSPFFEVKLKELFLHEAPLTTNFFSTKFLECSVEVLS